jgi:hypothetical protein
VVTVHFHLETDSMARENDTSDEGLGQWCDCSFCTQFPAIARLRQLVLKAPRSRHSTLLRAACWEIASLEAELDNRGADAMIYKSYAWEIVMRREEQAA